MANYLRKMIILCSALLVGNAHAGLGGGDVDLAFSGNGYELLKFPTGTPDSGYVQSMLIDKSGRIYLIGAPRVDGTGRFGIARYSAAGVLDLSFNGAGKVVTDASIGDIYPYAATFDNQGKVLVAGRKRISATNYDFFVCRFDVNGSLLAFTGSKNACVRTFIDIDPQFPVDEAYGIAVDDQDRVVLVGDVYVPGGKYGAVVRLNSDGSLDHTFDGGADNLGPGNGIVLLQTTPSIKFDHFRDVKIGADGNIYVVGTGSDKNDVSHRLITLNKLSKFGITFANFSTRTYDVTLGGKNEGNSLAFDRKGDLVIGGATNNSAVVLKASRVTGAPVTFGQGGKVVLTTGHSFAINDLAVTHDDRIVAAGTYEAVLGGGQDILAVRLTKGGGVDGSFGSFGIRQIDMMDLGENDYAKAIALMPHDERPVIAGFFDHTAPTTDGETVTMTRLTNDQIFFDTHEEN